MWKQYLASLNRVLSHKISNIKCLHTFCNLQPKTLSELYSTFLVRVEC